MRIRARKRRRQPAQDDGARALLRLATSDCNLSGRSSDRQTKLWLFSDEHPRRRAFQSCHLLPSRSRRLHPEPTNQPATYKTRTAKLLQPYAHFALAKTACQRPAQRLIGALLGLLLWPRAMGPPRCWKGRPRPLPFAAAMGCTDQPPRPAPMARTTAASAGRMRTPSPLMRMVIRTVTTALRHTPPPPPSPMRA